MLKPLLLSLLLSALALPAAAQVRLVEAGLYCVSPRTGERIQAPDTEAGFVEMVEDRDFDVLTRTIPLQLGLSFNIRTELKADAPLPVRMVTRHPPMAGAGGRTESSYDSTLSHLAGHVRGFTFDYPYEMVPGTWTFEVWDGDALLLAVDFDVVDGPVAAVDQACAALLGS